ncbi:PAS domain S-box protein, partial [bacterium]|nr:PAS domain S-box protein [bacterium]
GKNAAEILLDTDESIKMYFYNERKKQKLSDRYEIKLKHKNGSDVFVEVYSTPYSCDLEGKVTESIAVINDLTERKQEEKLRLALYRIAEETNALENLQDFYAGIHKIINELIETKNFYISLYDENTQMVSFPYFVDEKDTQPEPKILGSGLTELVLKTGKHILVTEEEFEKMQQIGEIELVGSPTISWLGVPLKIGEKIFGLLVVQSYSRDRVFNDKDKEILIFVSQHIASAIEHKKSEEELKLYYSRLKGIIESTQDIVFALDKDYRYLAFNENHKKAMQQIYGLKIEIGKNILDFMQINDDDVKAKQDIDRCFNGEQFIIEQIYGDEKIERAYFEASYNPIKDENDKITGAAVFVKNVSERKISENKIIESEKLYRQLFEKNQAIKWIVDPETLKIIDANPAAVNFYGYSLEKLKTMRIPEINVLSEKEIQEKVDQASQEEKTYFIFQHKLASGEIKTVEIYSGPIKIEGKTLLHSIIHDITDRKKAEQELFNEKEMLAVTLKSIGDGVITTDTKGNVLLVNQIAEELTAWKQEDAFGKPLTEVFRIINESNRSTMINPVTQVLQTGEIVLLANHTILIAKDETEKIIADSAAPIRNKDGEIIGVVLVFRDVTEKYKMEDELARASKLESIGVLAGGIAHDFNNMLTGILGNVSLVKMMIEDEKLIKRLQEVEKASHRAQTLTQQLLTFSKGGTPVKKIGLLSDVLVESVEFTLRGSKVHCDFKIEPNLWTSEFDAGQINQVINNLVINATHAMPDGGKILVKAENLKITSNDLLPIENGDYIKISVQDFGIGIAKESFKKIFDPYFTTKEKGHGLGLATTYSIIKKHNGFINLDSEVGKGTTFYIYLPACKNGEKNMEQEKKQISTKTNKGKILVMDDDEQIREMLCEMIEMLGYNVELAKDGEETIEIYRNFLNTSERVDLLIMDLTIPGGMGGKETIEKLLKIDPNVKAIVSSGYSDSHVMSNYQSYGFSGIVQKPYDMKKLIEVLKETMKNKTFSC